MVTIIICFQVIVFHQQPAPSAPEYAHVAPKYAPLTPEYAPVAPEYALVAMTASSMTLSRFLSEDEEEEEYQTEPLDLR